MTLRAPLAAQGNLKSEAWREGQCLFAFPALTRGALVAPSDDANMFFVVLRHSAMRLDIRCPGGAAAFFLYGFPMFRAGVYNGLTSRKPTGQEGDRL